VSRVKQVVLDTAPEREPSRLAADRSGESARNEFSSIGELTMRAETARAPMVTALKGDGRDRMKFICVDWVIVIAYDLAMKLACRH
jgi:hypothetical protein